MADHDPDPSVLGRDTGSEQRQQSSEDRGPQGTNGIGLTDQLATTTSESAGGNVSGTGEACEDLDIVFEPENAAH